MTTPLILDDDIAGERTLMHRDGKNVVFERQFDSQPVMDEISAIKSITDGKSRTGELYHIGRIPAAVVEAYCNVNGVAFSDFLKEPVHHRRILEENSKLRIWEGNL